MDTLDGFILNVFRTENPILTQQDFQREGIWVCDLLNQDLDLATEFIKSRLKNCASRMDKLEFLYESKNCYKYTILSLEEELQPDYKPHFPSFPNLSKDQKIERLQRYKKAMAMTDQAICYYIDCSTLDCSDKKPSFVLSKKKGKKTDLIRILNAIYELKMIENENGQIPSKEIFMKQSGLFFGTDLSKYEIDLSQSLNNTSLEANLKVFEEMKTITQNNHYVGKKGM